MPDAVLVYGFIWLTVLHKSAIYSNDLSHVLLSQLKWVCVARLNSKLS